MHKGFFNDFTYKVLLLVVIQSAAYAKPLDRVVCLGRGCLRMLAYLDATQAVVGVEQQEKKQLGEHKRPYLDAYPRLRQLPAIGPGMKGDAEKILATQPKAILWAGASDAEAKTLSTQTGIDVVIFNIGNLTDHRAEFFAALSQLGALLGKTERADSVKYFLLDQFRQTDSLAKILPSPFTVYVGGLSYQGCNGLAGTHPTFTPFLLLNLDNVAKGMPNLDGNPIRTDMEQIVQWNPKAIFVDKACLTSVEEDLEKFSLFRSAIEKGATLYPSNSYGENWELTLANTFLVAFQILGKDGGEQKKEEILKFLLKMQ